MPPNKSGPKQSSPEAYDVSCPLNYKETSSTRLFLSPDLPNNTHIRWHFLGYHSLQEAQPSHGCTRLWLTSPWMEASQRTHQCWYTGSPTPAASQSGPGQHAGEEGEVGRGANTQERKHLHSETPWVRRTFQPWLLAHPIRLRFKDDIQVGKRKAEIWVNNIEYNGQQRELWAWGHHGFASMVLGSFLPNKYQQYSLLPYQKGNRSWGKSPQELRDWRG